ncbi:MAG TPA: RICIN domain-containing protein [Pseudonocardiaceae bacterium]|nr:RICIN domain-containing protein [Pseudonocardiaceae bacterium]
MSVLAVAVLAAAVATAPAHAATSTSITVNGTATGRTFDGIGAISGGGGNSRLLMDYPEPARGQILDYLFSPGVGADLQILKVEIGGDTNSTDGSESSVEHTRGTVNCANGYEWWLMAQAKQRDPGIKLYGLAWGAPGWIGNGNFWTTDMINYLLSWLGCAKSHGLTIDYLGGWNERGYNIGWYENLRTALNANGYGAVRVVGADSDWTIANDLVSNPTFAGAVDIVGAHYPCAGGDGGDASTCSTTSNALATGKPLWASENGSQDDNAGAPALIRSIVRGYTDAKYTAYINWPLIAAIYPNLGFDTTGLMVANQPWAGNYSVGASLWATAQVTQFTQPGWRFLDSASGYLGGQEGNGAYVSLVSPNGSDYTTILETTTATAAQTVTIAPTGGLSSGTAHVWSSKLTSTNPADYLVHSQDVTPTNGQYTLTLQPGEVYTVTTTTGQGKGTATSPPQASLGLPYVDTFDADATGTEAKYLSDQNGSFEIRPCPGGRAGQCVRQMAAQAPINWDNPSNPYTLLGDLGWTNYTVAADAYLEQAGAVQFLGRVQTQQTFSVAGINDYYLQVANTGAWSIVRNTTGASLTTLAGGTAATLGTGTWHHLALSFQGGTITAALDGTTLGSAADASYVDGQVGLGTNGWQTQDFDNLTVTPIGAAHVSATYQLVNRNSGDVLDVAGDGVAIVQNPSSGVTSQQWQLVGDDNGGDTLLNVASGKTLDVPGSSTSAGTALDQAAGTGGANQQWAIHRNADGFYAVTNLHSNLAADVGSGSTAAGAPVIQWTATGGANQEWSLVLVPVSGATYVLANRNSGLVMDVNGASTSDGAGILQWPYHGGANERWTFTSAGTGAYTLTSANSGKVLDVPNQSTTQGVVLDQWTGNGGTNQQWRLTPAGNGAYDLVNVNSGLLADVSGASTTQGANVLQWPSTGGANQQWLLSLAY